MPLSQQNMFGFYLILPTLATNYCSPYYIDLDKYHAWVNADFLLEKCLVGTLDDGEGQQHSKH